MTNIFAASTKNKARHESPNTFSIRQGRLSNFDSPLFGIFPLQRILLGAKLVNG